MHYDWLAILAFVSMTSALIAFLVVIIKPGWKGSQQSLQTTRRMAVGFALMWPRTAYVVFFGRTNSVLLSFLELLMFIGCIVIVWVSSRIVKDLRQSRL